MELQQPCLSWLLSPVMIPAWEGIPNTTCTEPAQAKGEYLCSVSQASISCSVGIVSTPSLINVSS